MKYPLRTHLCTVLMPLLEIWVALTIVYYSTEVYAGPRPASQDTKQSASFVLFSLANDKDFQRATEFIHQKQYTKAHDILLKLNARHPNNLPVMNNLAITYLMLGKLTSALETMRHLFLESNALLSVSYHNFLRLNAFQASLDFKKSLGLTSVDIPNPHLTPISKNTTRHFSEQTTTTKDVDRKKSVFERIAAAEENMYPLVEDPRSVSNTEKKQLTTFVRSWAKAWENQNLDIYFAKYADNYTPLHLKISHEVWKKQRKQRILLPSSIKVKITETVITKTNTLKYSMVFRQDYTSNIYRGAVKKELLVELHDGNPRIIAERILRRLR